MVGDITIDRPTYNAIFSAIAKGWPQHEDELDICMPVMPHAKLS